MLEYGFIDLYGVAWDKPEVDRYNKIQREIQSRGKNGYTVNEQLLNDSYRIFNEPYFTRLKEED